MKRLMIFAVWMALSAVSDAWAAGNGRGDGFEIFGAAGTAVRFASARVGYGGWEGGLLNGEAVGVDRVFRGDVAYAAFGFAALLAPETSFGPYAAVGMETPLFWVVDLRGELSAAGGYNGHVQGEILAGLSLRF